MKNNNYEKKDLIGDEFHERTKYYPNKILGGRPDWDNLPETYKTYPDSIKIELPQPNIEIKLNFTEILKKRKSIRTYSNKPLNLEQLSYLLWSSTGIQRIEYNNEFRTAPSAGALYPIETYLVVNNLESLDNGVYHYGIQNHELEVVHYGDYGIQIAKAALGQRMCAEAAVVFVFSAIFERSKWKYNQRAYRYIYMDAGHIAENLGLAVTALNLGGCHIAAIFDEEVNKILKIDGIKESAIYLMPVGSLK